MAELLTEQRLTVGGVEVKEQVYKWEVRPGAFAYKLVWDRGGQYPLVHDDFGPDEPGGEDRARTAVENEFRRHFGIAG